MPPKVQNLTFRIRRQEPHRLEDEIVRSREGVPPPIVSVAVGTAGYKRSWKWAQRMGEAGVLDRVQSLLMYDCNQGTKDSIIRESAAMRGRGTLADLPVVVPGYIPKVDGFLRDPNAYKDFYGRIDRDMENMVNAVNRRADEIGSPPQLILEWVGFGGHAKLAGILHNKLVEQFPEALFLPIVLLPEEHALKENMRRETWGAYEETMGVRQIRSNGRVEARSGFPALLTDNNINRGRDFERLDNLLAVGLASMESGMQFQSDSGSLAETVASFADYSNGWFGMRVASRRLETAVVRQRSRLFGPMRGRELVVVDDDSGRLGDDIKRGIWDILDPTKETAQLANHSFVETDSVMRMVITLPVDRDGVRKIEEDVTNQLVREDFKDAFPNLQWSFASANFQNAPEERRMHITLFYPLQDRRVDSISEIMHSPDTPRHMTDGMLQTGFGTGHFLQPNGHEPGSEYGYTTRGEQIRRQRERQRLLNAERQSENGYGNDYRP
jgi:hypothetical protein